MQTVLILCYNNFLLLLQTFLIIVHYRAICLWDRELVLLHNIKSCQFKQESNFSCQTNRKNRQGILCMKQFGVLIFYQNFFFFFLLNHYQIKLNPLYYQTFNERLKQKVDITCTNKLWTLATLNKMVMLLHMCIITRRKNIWKQKKKKSLTTKSWLVEYVVCDIFLLHTLVFCFLNKIICNSSLICR